MELDQGSKPQPQAIRVSLGKGVTQHLIKDKSGFEIGAGQSVFDPANAMTQVEALRMLLRSGKQALQPPSEVGSFADVGLGVCILAAQKKYSRGGDYRGEDPGVSFRPELDAFGQHKAIVVRLTREMQARFYALSSPALSRANARASRGTLCRAPRAFTGMGL